MGAYSGLIPHPRFGILTHNPAGSNEAPSEQPVHRHVNAFRPDASSSAFSMMLGLLETLRKLVLSGLEPASFLIAVQPDGRPVMVTGAESADELPRLSSQYGPISLVFLLKARPMSAGILLQVCETTGGAGYALDQLCRRSPGGGFEVLPHCWRADPPRARSSASSAYQSTSGLIPYFGFRNSSLLNQRIC